MTQLKADEPHHGDEETTEGVGLGATMQFSIGREDRFEIQTILDRDAPLSVWNETLDKIRKAGERQKAMTGIQTLESNLREQARQLKKLHEDTQRAEADYITDKETRLKRIQDISTKRDEYIIVDRQSWESKGRAGDYKPSTVSSQRIAAYDRDIESEQRAQINADRERENAMKSVIAEANSYKKQAEFCESEIKVLKEALEG